MDGSYQVVELDKYGGNLTQSTRNFKELKAGELLIKVFATTIHPSDLAFLTGHYGKDKPVVPLIPGSEGCGEIVKVGEGVDLALVGKRATFVASKSNQGSFEGAWAQYIYVYRQQCIIYQSSTIAWEKIASAFINPMTAVGFLDTVQKNNSKGAIQNGASGAVGKIFIRLCAKNGIKTINLVRKENQIEELKKLGADFVLSTTSTGWESDLQKLAEENQALVAFECVGDVTKILNLMPDGSNIYKYGNLEGKAINGLSSTEFIFKEKSLKGWWLSSWTKSTKPQELYKWFDYVRTDIESGSTLFETEFRTENYSLADIVLAKDTYSKNMSEGKVLIRPNGK